MKLLCNCSKKSQIVNRFAKGVMLLRSTNNECVFNNFSQISEPTFSQSFAGADLHCNIFWNAVTQTAWVFIVLQLNNQRHQQHKIQTLDQARNTTESDLHPINLFFFQNSWEMRESFWQDLFCKITIHFYICPFGIERGVHSDVITRVSIHQLRWNSKSFMSDFLFFAFLFLLFLIFSQKHVAGIAHSHPESQQFSEDIESTKKKAVAQKARGLLRALSSDHGSVGQCSWPDWTISGGRRDWTVPKMKVAQNGLKIILVNLMAQLDPSPPPFQLNQKWQHTRRPTDGDYNKRATCRQSRTARFKMSWSPEFSIWITRQIRQHQHLADTRTHLGPAPHVALMHTLSTYTHEHTRTHTHTHPYPIHTPMQRKPTLATTHTAHVYPRTHTHARTRTHTHAHTHAPGCRSWCWRWARSRWRNAPSRPRPPRPGAPRSATSSTAARTCVEERSTCRSLRTLAHTLTHTHAYTYSTYSSCLRGTTCHVQFTYTHTHTHTHTQEHTHGRIHAHTHTDEYTHTHAHTHTRTNIRTHTRTHTHAVLKVVSTNNSETQSVQCKHVDLLGTFSNIAHQT